MAISSAEGRIIKMEVDYSDAVAKQIPKSAEMARAGQLNEAVDELLALEKLTRQGGDAISSGHVLVAIVKICADVKNFDKMSEMMVLLSKRRSQFKQAVTSMVQEVCRTVETVPDRAMQLKIIEAIRSVTEGKIYVEVERARITYKLSQMLEAEGKVKEAAEVLQELQIETYGSMDRREKIELLLEQMRLCLNNKDYIRTQIISRKISVRFFEDAAQQDLKLKYYKLMILLDEHDEKFLNVSRHYNAIYKTKQIFENLPDALQALQCMISYLVLAPFDNEQSDLLHRVKEDKNLDHMLPYKKLVKSFLTNEIIQWSKFVAELEKDLRQGSKELPAVYVFKPEVDGGPARWEHLRQRVIEHNIRIMAMYYSRVSLTRLAQLLSLTPLESEEYIGKLVTKKTIFARIDRPDGVIVFRPQKNVNAVLDDWAGNVAKLMQMINQTTHLINKEEMVHGMEHVVAAGADKD
ncbi:26S proteasome non-ATPase regulatory subunit 12-like [Paramacrobiotus metropolitanus]|uniref:26S proteasome non-ATPase regulatory subunit 12-like n=1 Tax=Paramacrobiotus metropolitanus TaxID=2943436 RepID=UPI0024463CA4|nr:26S proteasome non-ATPase regulatory subunit 12-like [Paramacrobiotus metropolitanus]XP_055328580.1 26S proteasome non-ATPase regulatory subunit 12-like [Paramacrobiotus metropolitanus]XP_055328581.1 26S proteasome non-ATPase regulatory subunit 12-like [Paramacrobiotus metropolitanus]